MEEIDIFDADLRPLGKMERRAAHMSGAWHKTFHLWVVGRAGGGSVLYQWRSDEMENFPDMLDVSAAGHLLTGEDMTDGIREAEEELGLSFDTANVANLGYRVEVADQKNGQKNREYQGVHMVLTDHELSSFRPQVEEVSGLFWIGVQDGINLFTGATLSVRAKGIVYNKKTAKWDTIERDLSRDRFLPRIQNYYLTAHLMAERLLDGKTILSIS